jgi:hypothetical protein
MLKVDFGYIPYLPWFYRESGSMFSLLRKHEFLTMNDWRLHVDQLTHQPKHVITHQAMRNETKLGLETGRVADSQFN